MREEVKTHSLLMLAAVFCFLLSPCASGEGGRTDICSVAVLADTSKSLWLNWVLVVAVGKAFGNLRVTSPPYKCTTPISAPPRVTFLFSNIPINPLFYPS